MKAYLLKNIEFDDVKGQTKVLLKGDIVEIIMGHEQENLCAVVDESVEYRVHLRRTDYRYLREMN